MKTRRKNILEKIIFSSTGLTVMGFLILILISLPLIRNIKKQLSVNHEISTLQQEIENLKKKNTELKGLITYLNSDQFTEEQARLNLNYKKEGEEVVVIKDYDINKEENEKKKSSLKSIYDIRGLESDFKNNKDDTSNFKKWLEYFLN